MRHRQRREKLHFIFSEKEIDTLLITNLTNIRYLTGFTGSFAWLLLQPEEAVVLTSGLYTNQIAQEVPDLPIKPTAIEDPTKTLVETIQEVGTKRLGFEAGSVTYQFVQTLQERLQGVELVPLENGVESLRLIKEPQEIELIRQAVGIVDAAFEHIQRLLRPEMTEWDLAMEIDFFIRRQGALPAFETLVVSGERSAFPHGRPTERRLQEGDFVTLDFGARYQGYCSDITRTVVIGRATEEQKRLYQAVLEAVETCLQAIRPGRKGKEIDALAREVFANYQLEDYFGHSLGHSIGLTVHDGPGFSQREENELKAGMVATVEPGVYLPGLGGVRIEEDILITETGCEVLTRSPRTLMEFDWGGLIKG